MALSRPLSRSLSRALSRAISGGIGLIKRLLDLYPGAAAAYSLQDIGGGGNVIRARRSSDNEESDFTASDITGGALTSWAGVGDAFVTTWYDQSGSLGEDLSRFANRKSADDARMLFDGVDDYVSLPQSSYPDFSQSFVISCSVAYEDNGLFGRIWTLGNSGTNTQYASLYRDASNNLLLLIKNDAGTTVFAETLGDPALADGNVHTVDVSFDGTDTITATIDGTPTDYAITPSGTFTFNNLTLGGWVRLSGPFVNPFTGLAYDLSYTLNGVLLSSYQGYGNTDADWEDQVGSNDGTVNGSPSLYEGRNALQPIAASQPQIVDNGVIVTDSNGNPSINFDGSDDRFTTATSETITEHSLFTVFELQNSGSAGRLYSHDDGSLDVLAADCHIPALQNNSLAQMAAYDGAFIGSTATAFGDTALWSCLHSGSLISPFLNGSSASTASRTLNVGLTRQSIGGATQGTNFYEGRCSELVVYNSDQSANRAEIEAEIAARYDITLS